MRVWGHASEGRVPRVVVSLGGVEHSLTVEEATDLRAGIDAAIESVSGSLLCWCGHVRIHKEWCRAHAPRCRSGAHFHGNCMCKGETP